MIKTIDNGFAFTGFLKVNDSTFVVRLLKTDYEGNQEWFKLYGLGQSSTGRCVRQTSDSGFIIIGRKDTSSITSEIYIVKTDKDGNTGLYVTINTMSEEIPENFFLYQNYPNPFNPSTVINYQLSMINYISLKVYDILGKEVATLVNEKQNAGSYSVIFDGSNYPSGVYFYRLEVDGKIIDMKRMILLK